MYAAMILLIFAGNQQMQFEDTRGPYQTEEECKARLVEMHTSAVTHFASRGLVRSA